MPTFEYKAINRSGQTVRGRTDAPDRQTAVSALAQLGQFVDEIKPAAEQITPPTDTPTRTVSASAGSPPKIKQLRLSEQQRAEFISQLGTALSAGLNLLEALAVVGQEHPHPRVKQITADLARMVRSGQSFSAALACYPRNFDRMTLAMVEVGETAGRLDHSMTELARLTELELKVRNDIMTAALYPAFVLCLGLISLAIIVTWILPQILSTLSGDVSLLAWPTRAVMAFSGGLRDYGWLVLAAMIALLLLLNAWRKTATGRYLWDATKLRLPVLGPLERNWGHRPIGPHLGHTHARRCGHS